MHSIHEIFCGMPGASECLYGQCSGLFHADVDAKIEPPEHRMEPKHDTDPAHWDEPHG
jgi:hypothetical protein